jgi:hypothetical protein
MNVEVLGDDLCYGSAVYGNEIMYGGWLQSIGKAAVGIGKGIKAVVKSPTGKSIGSAALTSVAGRMNPTQKAALATIQETAGMAPQVVTGGGITQVAVPTGFDMSKNLPLIIGGVAVVGVLLFVMSQKRRSPAAI